MTRVGLLARADNRGLGILTWAFYRNVRPEQTLVVDVGAATVFDQQFDRYPDGTVAEWDPQTGRFRDETLVRDWLSTVDVVYTAETPYDYRILTWAREAGVGTVVHVMPEFHKWIEDPSLPEPTEFWAPTGWRAETVAGPIVPVPVDTRAHPRRQISTTDPVVLHIRGRAAKLDRNGTRLVREAAPWIERPVLLRSQDSVGYGSRRNLRVEIGDVDDETLWSEGDVLLAPRRYGGLSLPMNEAQARGLALVTLDTDPQRDWTLPDALIPAITRPTLQTQGGTIRVGSANPGDVARVVNRVTRDPALLAELAAFSIERAEQISWDRMLPEYRARFAGVADRVTTARRTFGALSHPEA